MWGLDQRVRGVVGREDGGVEPSETRELARERGAPARGVKGVGEEMLVAEFLEVEAAYEWSSSPSLGVTRPLEDESLPLLWKGFQLILRGTVGLSLCRSVIGRWQSWMEMGKCEGRWERMMGVEKKV